MEFIPILWYGSANPSDRSAGNRTAVMEQVAAECKVRLVAYTITHHTRQSAVGLPKIVTRNYGGTEIDITEYTMSEIIASVYEYMEQTGKKRRESFL